MPMFNPPHPGRIVRMDCIEALGLTVTAAAAGLGVSRKGLSEFPNGHSGVSPEMAIRLAKGFGSTAEHWLRLQMAYDLWQLKGKAESIKVEKFRMMEEA